MGQPLDLFAVCAPGLEPHLADELRALGLGGQAVGGGVELRGDLQIVAQCNLWLRTASRLLVRLGRVRATAFPELVKKAKALPFELCIARGRPIALRVTCRKSRLYHSGAVAERLHAAIEARLGGAVPLAPKASEDDDDEIDGPEPQLIVARFERDECTVSADSSGALLHRRGWRARGGKAPLRETLAAALLRAAGWRGTIETGPLFDPLCGSGTIAIEAALLARKIAPGLSRSFAFQSWPGHDAAAWRRLCDDARNGELPRAPVAIVASDLDAAVIATARDNARRAGVAAEVRFDQRPLAQAIPPEGKGALIANAPYGVRIGAGGDLRQLFRELGALARGKLAGWRVCALVADAGLSDARAADLSFERALRTQNGGIPVSLLVAAPK